MTSTYVVLLHDDEQARLTADEEARDKLRQAHVRFAEETLAGGHRIVGGEALQASATAIVIRNAGDGYETTEGPYAETVEQVGGFYQIETDDLPGLVEIAARLAYPERSAVEIRPIVDLSMVPNVGVRAHAAANA